MKGALHRIPSLENAEIRQFVNGPESFTPDEKFLFGEVPEVTKKYLVFNHKTCLKLVTYIGCKTNSYQLFD